jgi:hypothetical protein
MSRLPRPHIPLEVRCVVAERQLAEAGKERPRFAQYHPYGLRLRVVLEAMFGDAKVELHHRPALVNRQRKRNGKYIPDANDPDYLIYLREDDHDIETRVRGLHGQHSDLALARKRKRKERKAARPKTRWASRPLQSASRWPKKRKMR